MKKLIMLITLALCLGAVASEVVKTVSLTTTGTTTADATYTARADRVTSVLAVYQGVTTETNDCDMKIILNGLTTSEAVTSIALANVADTSAIQEVGERDVTADVNDIILLDGDVLWLDATGAAASNVVYKIVIKETKQ